MPHLQRLEGFYLPLDFLTSLPSQNSLKIAGHICSGPGRDNNLEAIPSITLRELKINLQREQYPWTLQVEPDPPLPFELRLPPSLTTLCFTSHWY